MVINPLRAEGWIGQAEERSMLLRRSRFEIGPGGECGFQEAEGDGDNQKPERQDGLGSCLHLQFLGFRMMLESDEVKNASDRRPE